MAKITKEELSALIADQVQTAVTAALQSKPADPPTPPADDPDGKPGEKKDDPEGMQRKYASIYMNTGAEPSKVATKQDKGIGWARAAKAASQSGGDPEKALFIAQRMYPQDDVLHREFKAMSVTAPANGGYLVPEIYANEFIELLRPQLIAGMLHSRRINMENGNLTIPKVKGGASAHYVGEKRAAKGSKMTVGNTKLSGKKLITKVIMTNDLIRSSSYGADVMVRDDALAAMRQREDEAMLVGKGTSFEPMGVLSASGIQTVSIGALPDTGITGTLMAKLLQKNVPDDGSLGYVMNGYLWEVLYNVVNASGHYVYRESMDKGHLGKHPYAVSEFIPQGSDANGKTKLLFGRWSDFVIGEQMAMEVKLFDQASVKDEDDSLISAVDEDCSILRLMAIHDFAIRHEESFVVAENVYTKS